MARNGSMRFTEALIDLLDGMSRQIRAVVPGKVDKKNAQGEGERSVDFAPGIGLRNGGEEAADGIVPNAPVLYPGGGGFALLWPVNAGDEVLGLAADRSIQRWRETREIGQAHTFERSHNVSDALIVPLSITAPSSAPADWGDDFVLVGPVGEALRVAGSDGAVTITRAGDPVATITIDAAGAVVITPAPGQTVQCGGNFDLALADQLVTAIDAMLAALVAAGAGPAYTGAGGAQGAWNGLKNTIATTTTKGA